MKFVGSLSIFPLVIQHSTLDGRKPKSRLEDAKYQWGDANSRCGDASPYNLSTDYNEILKTNEILITTAKRTSSCMTNTQHFYQHIKPFQKISDFFFF